MPLDLFHPAVAAWFHGAFPAPTAAQAAAWPAIARGRHTLIAAPTGSGKTLTAFMTAIDALVREGLAQGLRDETAVVYVSPLKALSNDIHINLDAPLAGIRAELERMGLPDVEIRTAVRTGDTPQSERAALRRKPPHILVTTPESLYVLLGSESGRAMLATVRTVIVDEIHAVAASKRGSHLALSLERLEALCGHALTRIGVSATQKPIGEIAKFLVGAGNLVRPDSAHPLPLAGEDGARRRERARLLTSPHEDQKPGPLPASLREAVPLPQAGEGETHATDESIADCEIVDIGYTKQRDLALELPPAPLSVIMSNDQWAQVYARVAELASAHRTTLVFVNTRRMAERAARHLGELLGKETVAAHHGSLAKELRLDAEQRLKRGDLRLLVATSSLELGIDIGDVDLVCQLGSPRAIAAFLQRAGRSGHAVGGVPKARLFPQSRDELVECAALLDCVRRGELDALKIPPAPLDVLAQQIVAEVACREWDEDALYDWLRRAWPYARLPRETFDAVLRMLAEGYATRRGARAGLLHRDAVNRKLRGRQGARMTAVMSGGTIPDTADYAVIMEPQAINIGSVHEDFAVESLAGDVFQLGNASYRILRIEPGRLRVEDAQGAPPNIPFWIGEAPGRTDELSIGVSRLREEVVARLQQGQEQIPPAPLFQRGEQQAADGVATTADAMMADTTASTAMPQRRAENEALNPQPTEHPTEETPPFEKGGQGGFALAWLVDEVGLDATAAHQLVDYLARTQAALGTMPTQHRIVLERFFDESGGTQLVIHTPFGSRVNRAWGLALRKRFCRKFNFELQAAATEDAIVLSLSTSHSFPLIEVAQYLHSNSALDVLVQALLDAPLFGVRWRWNATTALALPRFVGGRKVAPQLQRMKSEDLLATVFPDQVACLENIVGERQVPDHPLVAQTLHDCLYEAMDAGGWLRVLRGMESGAIEVIARDLAAPSPLAMEALHARPYAFLDDAPLEERRTQAVQSRRYADPEDASDLGRLDPDAIAAVREEAWPQPRNADEMHEALMSLGFVTETEADANSQWATWLQRLTKDQRAALLSPSPAGRGAGERGERSDRLEDAPRGKGVWICAERLPQLQTLLPDATLHPRIEAPSDYARESWTREVALVELLRARLGGLGPVTVTALAAALPVDTTEVEIALLQLQSEGVAMQGHFSSEASAQDDAPVEWCERHLLARIHRYTLRRLRREIEPVEPRDFMRFLCDWQHVSRDARVSGPDALAGVIAQLEGFEAPAGAWETELLPARVADYAITWLDDLCTAGRVLWTRLRASADSSAARGAPSLRATPIVLLPRRHAASWTRLAATTDRDATQVSSRAQKVLDALARNGASFFDELVDDAHLLRIELEEALAELVARGRIHCDSFAGLRALLVPASKRPSARSHGRRRVALFGIEDAGRWALIPGRAPSVQHDRNHDEGQDTFSRHPREGGDPANLVLTSSGHTPTKATAKSLDDQPAAVAERTRLRGNDERKPAKPDPEAIEHVARTLLRRYGVVCWRLLEREAAWLPPWRELLRVYHRLEARGELRGGRFIAGLSGEQFALPDAVATLRRVRQRAHDGEIVCVSASDPLNLAGTVLAGDKVPRLPGARVAYRDGVPVAALIAGEIASFVELSPADNDAVRRQLLRTPEPSAVAAFAMPD